MENLKKIDNLYPKYLANQLERLIKLDEKIKLAQKKEKDILIRDHKYLNSIYQRIKSADNLERKRERFSRDIVKDIEVYMRKQEEKAESENRKKQEDIRTKKGIKREIEKYLKSQFVEQYNIKIIKQESTGLEYYYPEIVIPEEYKQAGQVIINSAGSKILLKDKSKNRITIRQFFDTRISNGIINGKFIIGRCKTRIIIISDDFQLSFNFIKDFSIKDYTI